MGSKYSWISPSLVFILKYNREYITSPYLTLFRLQSVKKNNRLRAKILPLLYTALLKEKYVGNNVCLCFKESFNQVQRINQIGQFH